jgi:hypothetical protein
VPTIDPITDVPFSADPVRDLRGEHRFSQEVLGVAAVDGVTGIALLQAQSLPAGQAVLAGAARVTQPRHGHPLPELQASDAVADGVNWAHALVARHERRGWLDRPVAVGGVNVGIAQAGGLHPDRDLPRHRLGN